MRVTLDAMVVGLRAHGEHGGIVRLMSAEQGLVAAYVRGARGKRMGPVLQPGNLVTADLSARTETQLPQAVIEMVHSRGPLFGEPLAAAAIAWACALTATALPEGEPFVTIHDALGALVDAIEAAPSAKGWSAALVRYELLLLAELGYGLDLTSCAVTGQTDDLVAVSPRSGRAVSSGAASPYANSLLPLPKFLAEGTQPQDWDAIVDGLALSGHFLARDLLTDRAANILDTRERLIERLRKAAGLA